MIPSKTAWFALLSLALLACRGEEADSATAHVISTAPEEPVGGAGGVAGAGGAAAAGGEGQGGGAGAAGLSASLLTWNLESFPLTVGAVGQAAEILEELAPDLVALQEISEPHAFSELLDELPDYDGVLNHDPGAYLRVGLLYRRGRVELSDVETLFEDDWYAFPRPPLKARVTLTETAPEPVDFVAVVVHLKAQLDAESEARRRAGNEALDAWIQAELARGEEQDYVVLGDFNDKLTDPPAWNVFGAFLDQPERYSFLTLPLAQAGEHSYIPFESMIDHVLVTADALDEIGSGATEVLALEQQFADYRDLTDHRPVRTWLRPAE